VDPGGPIMKTEVFISAYQIGEIEMSKLIFDSKDDSLDDRWTTGRIIDELFLNLVSIKEKIHTVNNDNKNVTVTVHKYYNQAREKMFRIPLYKDKTNMAFIIHISDLTERVRKELDDYYQEAGQAGLNMVLRLAVMKIFENLYFEYAHLNVMKNMKVRLID
jgi:hypothetical protein